MEQIQNTFKFKYDIDFNYLFEELNKVKSWYIDEISLIQEMYKKEIMNNIYNNSLYISNRHSEIVHKMIQKILKIINEKREFSIFLSNSFARGSNLFESDIDLNVVYEDKNIMDFEELLSFCIMFVIDKYRDFIHDSFSHRFSKISHNGNIVDIKLLLKNKVINYKITKGNEKTMINHYYGNNTFDYHKESLLEKSCYNEFYEYIYYQKIISNNKNLDKLFDNLSLFEKESINNENFKILILNTIFKFKNEIDIFNTLDIANMKVFKEFYKNVVYNKIFTVVAMYKRYDIYLGKELSLDNIYNYDNDKLYSYKELVNNYFGSVMQFAYLCYELNIGFRTRYNYEIPEILKSKFIEIKNVSYNEYFYKEAIKVYNHSIIMLEGILSQL